MRFTWLLFSFEGRVGRGSYWFVLLGLFVAVTLVLVLGAPSVKDAAAGGRPDETASAVAVFFLGAAWIWAAVSVKRLHDLGRPWWWLGAAVIPGVGIVGLVVMLGLISGTLGDNEYGPAPGSVATAQPQGWVDEKTPDDASLNSVVDRWRATQMAAVAIPVAAAVASGRGGAAAPAPMRTAAVVTRAGERPAFGRRR